MRDYVGVAPSSLPSPQAPDFHPRLRSMIMDIDYYLRDLSRGVQRISVGEVPDSSGTPIGSGGTLTGYWFRPGESGFGTAFMGTGPGESGTLSSTSSSTKGKIFLGALSAFDEANGYLGINEDTPLVALHVQGTPGSGTVTLTAASTISALWAPDATHYYTSLGGATTVGSHHTALASDDGASSFVGIQINPGNGTNPEKIGLSGTVIPGATYTVTAKVFTLSGTLPAASTLYLSVVDSTGKVWRDPVGQNITGIGTTPTAVTVTLTASGTPYATGETANAVWLDGSGDTSYVCVSYVKVDGPAPLDIARFYDSSGSLLDKINSSGFLGIGTDSDALTAMATVEASAAATPLLYLIGATSQSADYLQVLSQAGAVLTNINSVGDIAGGVLVSDALSLLSNTFNTSVARITLTNSQDVIFDVPSGTVDPLVISMGTVSATMSGLALTVNLQDTGGNNSTVTVDNRGGSASPIPLKVYRATNGSTANLTEWRDEVAGGSNAILSRISSSGTFVGPISVTNPSSAYTPTNVTTDRAYDANSTTLDEIADVLGTVIADLQAKGILG